MGSFLILDATDETITLCWEREDSATVEEVQMKEFHGGEEEAAAAAAEGTGGSGTEDGVSTSDSASTSTKWTTLSKTLTSSALRKKKLRPATAYVFRRRSKGVDAGSGEGPDQKEVWGPWSEPSEAFRTLPEGGQQAPPPAVKLREAGALVMEWPAIPAAGGYEVQMSASGGAWTTIAPAFKSTLLRKKGLEDSKQYRFRFRPLLEGGSAEGGGDGGGGAWSPASVLASPAVLNAFLRSQVPGELVGKGKEVVSRTVLAGKIVAFYFSASWCGPCRKYTPQLAALYAKAKAQHLAFEVVFVSLDSDEDSMSRYHAGMPWPAVPFDEPFREDFASTRGVNSIPRLLVTGRRGQDLSSNAVGMTWDQLVAWEAQG